MALHLQGFLVWYGRIGGKTVQAGFVRIPNIKATKPFSHGNLWEALLSGEVVFFGWNLQQRQVVKVFFANSKVRPKKNKTKHRWYLGTGPFQTCCLRWLLQESLRWSGMQRVVGCIVGCRELGRPEDPGYQALRALIQLCLCLFELTLDKLGIDGIHTFPKFKIAPLP